MENEGVSQRKSKKSTPHFATDISDASNTRPGEFLPGQLFTANDEPILKELVQSLSLASPLVN